MGRVLAPYGVKGWIKARPFTASPAALLKYERWWLAARDGRDAWSEFKVLSARRHGSSLLAELAGVGVREAAVPWRGALIGVPRAVLPQRPEGELYWVDLIGLTVVNRAGEVLGRVSGVLDTGVHPVLRVAGTDSAERLIPLVPAYVDAIEQGAARIVVDWQVDY